jgi:hypothetical protein
MQASNEGSALFSTEDEKGRVGRAKRADESP